MEDPAYELSGKYNCTLETLKATLAEHGVAVLPGVLSEAERAKVLAQARADVLEVTQLMDTPLDIDDRATYESLSGLFPSHGMLMQSFGLGHMQFVWDLRQNSKVVGAFQQIWGKQDLITSMDALSLHLPQPTNKRGTFKNRSWIHTDASPHRDPAKTTIQAYVSLFDAEEGDGTFCCIPGSHKIHKEFFEAQHPDVKKVAGDYFQLKSNADLDFFHKQNLREIALATPAGCMVFWDSRVFHQGLSPLKSRAKENIRLVAYICMVPRDFAAPDQLLKRIKYFEARRNTSHMPHEVRVFSAVPQTYGKPVGRFPEYKELPKLSAIGRRLVGYTDVPQIDEMRV